MFVADLLAVLESAHPADSVRILTRREGVGAQIAAVKVDDAMCVPGDPPTLLIKPAVELREFDEARRTLAASQVQTQQQAQRALKQAAALRQAADSALRHVHTLLVAGQVDDARNYLHAQLAQSRTSVQALAVSNDADAAPSQASAA